MKRETLEKRCDLMANETIRLKGKDLLLTADWSKEEIEEVLSVAENLKDERHADIGHRDRLLGKTIFLVFFDKSTRTRNSFEAGITQLGGHAHFISSSSTKLIWPGNRFLCFFKTRSTPSLIYSAMGTFVRSCRVLNSRYCSSVR